MTDHPLKVRYAEFSGWSDWTPCFNATVHDDVLDIRFDGGSRRDMIPLHVIRGRIEVRPNDGSDDA